MPVKQIIELPPEDTSKKAYTLTLVLGHLRPDLEELSRAAAMAIDIAILAIKEKYASSWATSDQAKPPPRSEK